MAMLNVPPAFAEFLTRQGAFAAQPGRLFGRFYAPELVDPSSPVDIRRAYCNLGTRRAIYAPSWA